MYPTHLLPPTLRRAAQLLALDAGQPLTIGTPPKNRLRPDARNQPAFAALDLEIGDVLMQIH